MSTAGLLNDRSKKELAEMARSKGVRGWEAMSKEELVKALSKNNTSKTPAKPGRIAVKAAEKTTSVNKVKAKVAAKPASPKLEAKPAPKPGAKSASSSKPVAASEVATSKDVSATPAPSVAVNGSHRSTPSINGASTAKSTGASTPAKRESTASTSSSSASTLTKSDAAKTASMKGNVTHPTPARDPSKDSPPAAKVIGGPTKDRIIMAVHDPYWLHVYWELSSLSVQRAEAALKQDWYGARLILRLYDVTSQDTTSTSETPIRDIPIESDGSNWYINVSQPPRQYRVDLGYLSRRGMLFVLARSNVVTPPKAGSSEAIDATWNMDTKKAERILAMSTGFESTGNPELREMFEERLKRSLGAPKETGFGTGATPPGSLKKFFFEIDAKLIVFGRTDPMAHLTLGNDPIKLDTNGTFMMSFSLPDSRQIIPAVATSADGVEERTIVLAVERNTKYLDPMIHDQMNEL